MNETAVPANSLWSVVESIIDCGHDWTNVNLDGDQYLKWCRSCGAIRMGGMVNRGDSIRVLDYLVKVRAGYIHTPTGLVPPPSSP